MNVTDEFYNAFCHASTIRQQCCCGRTTFDGMSKHDFEEGELESLRERAEIEPEKYIEVDYSIPWFEWHGNLIVIDCPCRNDVVVQSLIWNNRHDIIEFIKAITKRSLERATEDSALANSL